MKTLTTERNGLRHVQQTQTESDEFIEEEDQETEPELVDEE